MLTNVARTVIMALVGLLMVPYYIDQFGLATYAILPLATSVTNYFIIVSDSLSNAFSRYMTIAVQSGDERKANVVFTSAVVGMSKCILVLLPLVILIAIASPYIFHVGDSARADVQIMFLLIMVASLVISFGASIGGAYMAHNRLYITYLSRALQTLSQVGVVVFLFLLKGPSLPMVGLSFLVSALLMLIVMVGLLRRTCPYIRLSKEHHDRELLKEMGNLGLWSTLSELGTLLFIQASMIVVNMMLGSQVQGSFSIAANVIMMIHTACTALSAVSVPLAYREYAQGNTEGLVKVLRIFSKFIGISMAFPLAYLIVLCPQVLEAWLGPGYSEVYLMLYIMVPAEVLICTVSALVDVPIVYMKVRPVAIATLVFGVFNVVSAACIIRFTDLGVTGVCICWVLSMVLLKLVFFPLYCAKLTRGSLVSYLKPVGEAYAVFIILLVLMYGLFTFIVPPASWIGILVPMFVLFPVFFILEMRFMFTKEEQSMIKTYLPGFVQRFISHD